MIHIVKAVGLKISAVVMIEVSITFPETRNHFVLYLPAGSFIKDISTRKSVRIWIYVLENGARSILRFPFGVSVGSGPYYKGVKWRVNLRAQKRAG